jgi:hypothetical protein
MNDIDGLIEFLKSWETNLNRVSKMKDQVIMQDSVRLAGAKTQIRERGSIKDRLAQTNQEADILAKVEDLRAGRDLPDESPEETEAVDDAIIDRIISDYIDKTVLEGF